MYPRAYDVQPSSYSYPPQNYAGAVHFPYGYSQSRFTNYSNVPIQPQDLSELPRHPPPPLSHLTEQLSGNHRAQTEDRPSCMLQEKGVPVVFRVTSRPLDRRRNRRGSESFDDGIKGNFPDWIGFHAKFPAVFLVLPWWHMLLKRKQKLMFSLLHFSKGDCRFIYL